MLFTISRICGHSAAADSHFSQESDMLIAKQGERSCDPMGSHQLYSSNFQFFGFCMVKHYSCDAMVWDAIGYDIFARQMIFSVFARPEFSTYQYLKYRCRLVKASFHHRIMHSILLRYMHTLLVKALKFVVVSMFQCFN